MKAIENDILPVETAASSGFAVDTTFVLFFMAIEFGRTSGTATVDGFLLLATLLMLLVVPYFLPSEYEKPAFGSWLMGRGLIAGFGASLGVLFDRSLGIVFPELFRFLPMTLLIAAAMASCIIQFYGVSKFRLAK